MEIVILYLGLLISLSIYFVVTNGKIDDIETKIDKISKILKENENKFNSKIKS